MPSISRKAGARDAGLSKNMRARRRCAGSNRNHHLEQAEPSILSVYDGQRCIGFLMPRGREGWAAFNCDDELLGLFPDQASAANAIERGWS
jgi:hypothetical protein